MERHVSTPVSYKGVSGYIYMAEKIVDSGFQLEIPDAATSSEPVAVCASELVPDAYEAILAAEKKGLISVLRYGESSQAQRERTENIVRREYEEALDHPEYRHFLEGKFPFVKR